MKNILLWVLVALVLLPVSAMGQEGSGEVELPSKVPGIGEHTFVPNNLIGDPFVNTYVRNTLGIGQTARLEIPVFELEDGEVLSLRGDILLTTLDFEYQGAIKNWLAAWGHLSVLGRLGSGVQALLVQGVTAATHFEFGWMVRLVETQNVMLSSTFSVTSGSVTTLDIRGFVNRAIEDGGIEPDNLLVDTAPVTRSNLGVRAAYGVSKLLGFSILGEAGYGETSDRTAGNEWTYKLGGLVSIDLNKTTVVPLGFILGYSVGSILESNVNELDGSVQSFVFKINYTRPHDFAIGVELSGSRVPFRSLEKTVDFTAAGISMRYYF